MYKSALASIAGALIVAGLATSTSAAGPQPGPQRNQSETDRQVLAASAMNPPLVNWTAPPYYNPQRGAFSNFTGLGQPIAKSARTLATFVPVTPCRLVDTRGTFNPVY